MSDKQKEDHKYYCKLCDNDFTHSTSEQYCMTCHPVAEPDEFYFRKKEKAPWDTGDAEEDMRIMNGYDNPKG